MTGSQIGGGSGGGGGGASPPALTAGCPRPAAAGLADGCAPAGGLRRVAGTGAALTCARPRPIGSATAAGPASDLDDVHCLQPIHFKTTALARLADNHTRDRSASPVTRRATARAQSMREPAANQSLRELASLAGQVGDEFRAVQFSLDGSMIPRSAERMIDERSEERFPAGSEHRGDGVPRPQACRPAGQHLPSGAMVIFPHVPNIGEQFPFSCLTRATSPPRCGGSKTADRRVLRLGRWIARRDGDELFDDQGADRRGPERSPARLAPCRSSSTRTVRELGASGIDARVLNISESGFMAEIRRPFRSRLAGVADAARAASAPMPWSNGPPATSSAPSSPSRSRSTASRQLTGIG